MTKGKSKIDQQEILHRLTHWIHVFEQICKGQPSGQRKTPIQVGSEDIQALEQQMRQMLKSGFIVDPPALFMTSSRWHTGLQERSLQADTRNYPLSFWSAKERDDLDQLIGGDHTGWMHLGTNGFFLNEEDILNYDGTCVLTPDGPKALLLALYILRAKVKGEKAPNLIIQSETNKSCKKPFWHYMTKRLGLKKSVFTGTYLTTSATATRGMLDTLPSPAKEEPAPAAETDAELNDGLPPVFIIKTTGTHKIEELRRHAQGRAIILTYAEVFGAVQDPEETSVTLSGNANEKIESCYIGLDQMSPRKRAQAIARIGALTGYTDEQVKEHTKFFVDDRGVYFDKFGKFGSDIDHALFPPGLQGPGAELKPITDNARGIHSFMDRLYDYYRHKLKRAPDGDRYKDVARDVVVVGISSVFGEDRTPQFFAGSVGCDLAVRKRDAKSDPCFGDYLYPWGRDRYISELEYETGAKSPFGLAFSALADRLRLPQALQGPQINIIRTRDSSNVMTSNDLNPNDSHAMQMEITKGLDGFLFTNDATKRLGMFGTLALFYGMVVRRQMNETNGNTAILAESQPLIQLVDNAVKSGGMPQRSGLFQFLAPGDSNDAFDRAVREHIERPKLAVPEAEEDFHDPMNLFARFQDRPTFALYCSATNHNAAYQQEAYHTARYLLRHGFNVISGAGSGSSMGAIVQAYLDYMKEITQEDQGGAPSQSFGITAPHIRDLEGRANLPQGHVAIVRTLLERTQGLHELADGAVWLPGGFGTAYEGFRAAADNIHLPGEATPLFVMNNGGYYNFLKDSSLSAADLEQGHIHMNVPQNDQHPRDRLTELGRWLTANALQIRKNFETRRARLGDHSDKPSQIIMPYVLQAA